MTKCTPELKNKLQLSVGSQKKNRPLSPIEVAKGFQLCEGDGMTAREIADLVHFNGTGMIAKFKRLLILPEEVQDWVDWGENKESLISFTGASELTKLKKKSDQKKLAELAVKYNLKSSEIRLIVQKNRKLGQSINEGADSIMKKRL